jgi:DNA-binding MarR family transcriptional regulator/GNAT superfamily N-acetyltransferase
MDEIEAVSAIRRFGRFYTRQIELLGEGLLESPFSLTEARVLYELAAQDGVTASSLGRDLGLDAGYLSRILRGFSESGLIERTRLPEDARQTALTLTEAGRTAFRPLNETSDRQAAALLARLSDRQRDSLVGAMRTIERILSGAQARDPSEVELRRHRTGDLGWIAHRQGMLYAQEYGWDETFEALVAEILVGFVRDHDPTRERSWVAERDGQVLGSVFLVRDTNEIAKLRLLYVEPEARGLGLGRRLVRDCISFAREASYRTLTLWTNDILSAARRIYQAEGFVLVSEERHHSFGKDLVGQYWSLSL